jgi:hypothetical protein
LRSAAIVLLNSTVYFSFIEDYALLASNGMTVNDKIERMWTEAEIVVCFKEPSTFWSNLRSPRLMSDSQHSCPESKADSPEYEA